MGKYVYLYELDSVRKTDTEILIGQKALYHEIADNGNVVVLTLNQLCDSRAFFSLLDDEEDEDTYQRDARQSDGSKKSKRFEKHYFESLVALFEMGAIRISRFGKYKTIAGYLIDSLSPGRTFVYSGWPLKSTQVYLIRLIRNSLLFSDLSEIHAYKTGKYPDEELRALFVEINPQTGERKESIRSTEDLRSEMVNIYWFLKLVLRLSVMHDIYISPRDRREYVHCHMEDILEVVSRFDAAQEDVLWSDAIRILRLVREELHKEQKAGNRSNYVLKLKKASTGRPDTRVYMYAEAILNLCYNYGNEISIRNTSKRYNVRELTEGPETPTFREDFLRRLSLDWNTGEPEQKYLQNEIDRFDEYIPEKGFPRFYRAARIIRSKQQHRRKRFKKEEAGSEDIELSRNGVPRYEKGFYKERGKHRKAVRVGIRRGFCAVLVCMGIVIALEFLMQHMQDAMDTWLPWPSIITTTISTILVLYLTEIITVVLSKLFHGFLPLSDALALLVHVLVDGFGNIRRLFREIREKDCMEKNAKGVDETEAYSEEMIQHGIAEDAYHTSKEWRAYLELIDTMPAYFKKGYLGIITDEKVIDEYHSLTNRRLGVVYQSDYHD